MDLRQLRNMLMVMETGSLNKAAQRLGISQPALTKSIQRLESELNVPLFMRESRGMRPTVYAESMRIYARAACVGLSQTINEIEALRSGSSGVVTIAAPPVIADALFPSALLNVTRTHPGLQIRVFVQVDDLFQSLLTGNFDLLVATIPHQKLTFGLAHRILFTDKLVVAMRRDHPLAHLKTATPHELQACRWIFPTADNIHRRSLEHVFAAARLPLPRATIECREPDLIKALVKDSDYVGIIPQLAIQGDLDAGELSAVEINSDFMVRMIGLIWRDNHVLSPAIHAVIEAIEAVCHERDQDEPMAGPRNGHSALVAHMVSTSSQ